MRPDLYLRGAVRYTVSAQDASCLFGLLQSERFAAKGLKRRKKQGDIRFFLPYKHAAGFESAAAARALSFIREEKGGRVLGKRLLAAPGLLVGMLLALLLLIGARAVVWDIRITGTQAIPIEEVEQALEGLGLYRGAFLYGLHVDELALSLRQVDSRVGYAAINIKGTVVELQIRETEPVPAPSVKNPANLVAACDGVITMPLVFEGECLVEVGDVVRAGQILAGGLSDTQNHGFRVTRAAGQVMARTVHTYTVRVPLSYEEKVYTGEEKYELSLLFFQRAQKVFKNIGQNIENCDIIKKIQCFRTPAGALLPFGYRLTIVAAYEMQTFTRTAQQAREMALAELQQRLAADSAGRTLLEKSVEWSMDGEGITLICTVVCEEDIARTVEFAMQP